MILNYLSGFFFSPEAATSGAVHAAKMKSGKIWVTFFPTQIALSVLNSPFRENISAFIRTLETAMVQVKINATLRPPQRAYLMHYSFLIAKGMQDCRQVPSRPDVHIEWFHGNIPDSIRAAKDMVAAFGIATVKTAPALQSNHIAGNAIDMDIKGYEGKQIKKKDGTSILVKTFEDIKKIGESYKVYNKIPDDMPHWSTTGR